MLEYACVFYGGWVSGHQSRLQVPHLTSEQLNPSSPLDIGYFSSKSNDFDVVTSKESTFVQSEPDMNYTMQPIH
jgi:hypothetical protein